MLKIVVLILSSVLLFACEQKKIEEKPPAHQKSEIIDKVEKTAGELKMIEIQRIPSGKLQEKVSLRYERIDAGETVQVYTYYDKEGSLVKVIEEYNLGNTKNGGVKTYYFEGENALVAVVDSYEDWTNTDAVVFSEKRSFYENDVAVYTDFRTAEYYELIAQEKFQKIKTHNFNIDRVMAVAEASGSFQTCFLGIIETPSFPYILVGEPNKKDGFQSTLRISKRSTFSDNLLQNQNKYLNKPIRLEYKIIEENNFSFTEFINATWIK